MVVLFSVLDVLDDELRELHGVVEVHVVVGAANDVHLAQRVPVQVLRHHAVASLHVHPVNVTVEEADW